MKKFYPYLLILAVPVILLLMSNSTGSPGGKTNSPGDGFNNCTDCHFGNPTINQTGWITSNIPIGGYMAGEEYIITVTGTHENVQKFGFELTAEDLLADKTGDFTLLDDTRTRFTNLGDAVTHTATGNMPTGDSNSWEVAWTAPSEGTGSVTFYAALNAANGNGTTTGDQIYLTTMTVPEFTVGLPDKTLSDKVDIFPNPAGSYVNLYAPANSDVRMADISGREIMNFRMEGEHKRVNLSDLERGVYLIIIGKGKEQSTYKLVRD